MISFDNRQNSVHRLLKQRTGPQKLDQLLWSCLAAYRPEALTASSGHDDYIAIIQAACGFVHIKVHDV
jgi:hypothetical protein